MSKCTEHNYDDLLSVMAIPVGNLSWANVAKQMSPTLAGGDYNFLLNVDTATGSIFIGRDSYRVVAGKSCLPASTIKIVPASGDVSDEESDDVGGRSHKVVVKFEVNANTASERNALLALERGEFILELRFFGDTANTPCRALVQATQDTYQCTVKREGKETSVSIVIENLMGLQMVE